jgi:capsular polysaccharide biosynthesis protein
MQIHVKAYVQVLLRRWWIIAAVVCIACAATIYVQSSLIAPEYEASSKLIISTVQDGQDGTRASSSLDYEAVRANVALIGTYMEIIKSSNVMNEVSARLPEWNLTSDELDSKVLVGTVPETQVLSIYATDENYERASAIVRTVTEVFSERVSAMLGVLQVQVLNEVDPNNQPSPSNISMTIALVLSFVASLLIGIGIVTLLEFFNDTIRTEEEMERIYGVPVLAAIPSGKSKSGGSARIPNRAGETKHVTINS